MNYIDGLTRENFPLCKRKTYIVEGKENDSFSYKTVVTLKDSNGNKYRGETKISKADVKYYSKIAGFQIAERRAYLAYLKNRVESLKS